VRRAQALSNRALVHWQLGAYAEAATDYRELLETVDTSGGLADETSVLLSLGLCMCKQRELLHAVPRPDRAPTRRPSSRMVRVSASDVRRGQAGLFAAPRARVQVKLFSLVLARDPHNVVARLNRGNAYYDLNEPETVQAGRRDYLILLHLYPDCAPAQVPLG
jgi:tetratricopeptide (TPR) repeat protein